MPLPKEFDPLYARCWQQEYGPFADDYVAFDLESTGLAILGGDRILQFGFCVVKNRTAGLSADYLINWPGVLKGYQLSEFHHRLEATRARMTAKGKAFPWTTDLLRERGLHPDAAAEKISKLLGPDTAVAAHYGANLDFPMVGKFLADHGRAFAPDTSQMVDTCLLTRACILGVAPMAGEDPISYYRRIDALPHRGPRCSLEACVDHFDLAGGGASKVAQHLAAYDSWLVHLILEKLRSLTGPVKELVRG